MFGVGFGAMEFITNEQGTGVIVYPLPYVQLLHVFLNVYLSP